MLTFRYCIKGQGEAYILNYKTNVRGFESIPKLKSGGTILHGQITLTSLLPYYPIVPRLEIHKQNSICDCI